MTRKHSCLPGERYGKLVVLYEAPSNPKGRMVVCRCDCGVETRPVSPCHLGSGHKTSCGKGTCRGVVGSSSVRWKGCGEISGHFWANVRQSAKSRGYQIDVTIEDAWSMFLRQGRACALSGLPLSFEKGKDDSRMGRLDSATTASFDRIDSEKAYTIDNVQWVHKDVNRMKMELPEDRFVELCRMVADHAPVRTLARSA